MKIEIKPDEAEITITIEGKNKDVLALVKKMMALFTEAGDLILHS